LIDGLINSYSEETAFIAATSLQYATDAGDMARLLSEEIVENQSHDPPVGDAASSPTEASNNSRKRKIDWSDSQILLELLSEEFLDLNSGNCVDLEHEADPLEVNNTVARSSGHLRAGRIPGRSVTAPFNRENHFHTTATENSRSKIPAVVHIRPIEEIEQRGCASTTPKSGKFACSQDTALTRILKGGKILEGTSDNIPYESTNGADMQRLKKRGLTPSAGDNDLEESRTRKLRKQIHESTKNLNDLYLATAGSECQLKGMIDAIRCISSSTLPMGNTTIAEILRMLDAKENFQHATGLLRRICFLKLWQLREISAARFTNDREQRPDEEQPTVLIVGISESNILDALMTEAFPEITPRPNTAPGVHKWRHKHKRERKSLKNRLQVAKKWHSLSKRFPCGILAVIPSGGQFEISNHKYAPNGTIPLKLLMKEGSRLCQTAKLKSC
jgi:hypothetical protein